MEAKKGVGRLAGWELVDEVTWLDLCVPPGVEIDLTVLFGKRRALGCDWDRISYVASKVIDRFSGNPSSYYHVIDHHPFLYRLPPTPFQS